MRKALLILSCASLIYCNRVGFQRSAGEEGTPCVNTNDCTNDQACHDQVCRESCNSNMECQTGYSCSEWVCLPESSAPPVLQSVDGSGSVDGTTGHTPHHLRDRLVILGSNLVGASVTLTPPTGSTTTLAACSPETSTDTRLEVALPTSVVAGQHTLAVANQAGACNATLNLLQGEPGNFNITSATAGQILVFDGTNWINTGDVSWDTTGSTLSVTGDIAFTGVITDTSDARAKENIRPLKRSLDKLAELDAVAYNLRDDPKRRVEYGLLAQQVAEVFPELVKTRDDNLALNYLGMIAPMVEAIGELKAENEALRADLEALKKQRAE